MGPRRFVGLGGALAVCLALFIPVVACETDQGGGMPFVNNASNPDVGWSPSTAVDAAPPEPDAAADASISVVPAACDDGKVDPDETCDPLASCPTACPAVQCQLRTLEGLGTCAAKCVNGSMQTACINGDGCCPADCNETNDDDCGAVCGNGVVETGELCDSASCPASCPALGCQLRTLQGAGTCQAQCVNSGTQTACVSGDSCCPAGCNSVNDTDCGPGCGNGVLEGGETCDPVSSCPTTCPQLGCQLRALAGAGTCQAQCVNAGTQTACVNGDGCCPSGCNANTDNDCQPSCGNGVLEKGETCDGACPTSCPQVACQLRKLDNPGTCQATCTPDGFQQVCVNGDGCCPKGCNANNDNDCKAACGNGVIEPGETCDPPGSCTPCEEKYTCYQSSGSAKTCNLACHDPITTCGAKGDACCPYDGAGGCTAKTDSECGGGWKWLQWPGAVDTTKGCVNVVARGIVAGGSYEVTTCAPPGEKTGTGDPSITQVIDDSQVTYDIANDNCSDATSLPVLAGSNCKNQAGQLTMACASPSPGGFMPQGKATAIQITICSGKGGAGTTPVFLWYNASKEPSLSTIK